MRGFFVLLLLFISCFLPAQETEKVYLSGKGLGETVKWKFYCTDGRNSKKWSTIEVPSQWELQGFGEYTYGRWYKQKGVKAPSMEQGIYKHTFSLPRSWKGNNIRIVFEGAMTDTEVLINGTSAGEIHQGGFYRFSYDITDKLVYGKKNELEVKLKKHSDNKSVNAAERKADWWLFGGIYRPVYLEIKPESHIRKVAVDARADGSLYAKVELNNVPKGYTLSASVLTLDGKLIFADQSASIESGQSSQSLSMSCGNVKLWTPETPNLYQLKIELVDENKQIVHEYKERIGFRTVEFRPQDGIYVNGTKVVMKGINRHSFYPDGGRCTNRNISLQDALLLKEMNMNAVRSHYPPDTHFLEMCDSLGLFVINELAGWQNAYDDKVGGKLQEEMVERDMNHPCIVLWSNGNEGGWNTKLDKKFADYDMQNRHVIHPWADFNDLDTHHYPAYQTGVARFINGYKVFMPTEFMHGMYDQGLGAGLEDFWNNYISHPLFAGGFMWAFSDEAVKRVDKGGILDSDGYNAPDGILGPYREKEGSFYTVRELWAPIQFGQLYLTPSFNGEFLITNRYLYTNLDQCKMAYRLLRIHSPLSGTKKEEIGRGEIVLPKLEPGETGKARIDVTDDFFKADVLELEAWDQCGKSICTWTWPVHYAKSYVERELKSVHSEGKATYSQDENNVVLSAENVNVSFDIKTGFIVGVQRNGQAVSFANGPVPVGMRTKFRGFKVRQEGNNTIFTASYQGGVDSIRWCMTPSGLLSMDAVMLNRVSGGGGFDDAFIDENILNLGFSFDYPEEKVMGVQWMGKGPYRVWKNRLKGTNYGLWEKAYNNTITGESFESLVYPEFKGYHANLYWMVLQTKETPFTVYSESDGVYFHLFTPEEPKGRQDGVATMPEFPQGNLSFLYEIPAIRSFKPISQHGLHSQPGMVRIKKGDEGIKMKLWFDFR